jgi:arylsulfatase A-like enzyme
MKAKIILLALIGFLLSCNESKKKESAETTERPNVLLIAVDDLNDWIGVLGGHPQAKTPNIDELANRGVLFSNAQCQAPACNPSRASLMTSLYPSTTGIYFLNPDISESPIARKNKVMPKRFQLEGYTVFAAGKLFHNGKGINEAHIPNYAGQFGGFGPMPDEKISAYPGHPLWDWGTYPQRDEQMPDYKIATWAEVKLAEKQEQPFWMGVGFYRPHVPQFVPKKWFDLYPLESLELPKTIADDLNDISSYGKDITREKHVSPTHKWVTENDEWKPIVQSYLACVSFVDEQVGRVLKALDKGDYGKNTYVVLFSDHGFHIGEKERHAKRSLWEDGTRVPMILMGPGITKGKVSNRPVQLLDIYPTLLELSKLEPDASHEGNSLVPLLQQLDVPWTHYARTSFGPGNYAIVSEQYRFIQYNDSSEEFYDHLNDPNEWHNEIENQDYADVIENHRAQLPKERHAILGKGSTGHLSYEVSQKNIVIINNN